MLINILIILMMFLFIICTLSEVRETYKTGYENNIEDDYAYAYAQGPVVAGTVYASTTKNGGLGWVL